MRCAECGTFGGEERSIHEFGGETLRRGEVQTGVWWINIREGRGPYRSLVEKHYRG
jgi:hypothetical protein